MMKASLLCKLESLAVPQKLFHLIGRIFQILDEVRLAKLEKPRTRLG